MAFIAAATATASATIKRSSFSGTAHADAVCTSSSGSDAESPKSGRACWPKQEGLPARCERDRILSNCMIRSRAHRHRRAARCQRCRPCRPICAWQAERRYQCPALGGGRCVFTTERSRFGEAHAIIDVLKDPRRTAALGGVAVACCPLINCLLPAACKSASAPLRRFLLPAACSDLVSYPPHGRLPRARSAAQGRHHLGEG